MVDDRLLRSVPDVDYTLVRLSLEGVLENTYALRSYSLVEGP